MNNTIKIIGVCLIGTIIILILSSIGSETEINTTPTPIETRYTDDSFGLSFSYKTGDEGYVLSLPEVVDPENVLQKILVLTRTEDAEMPLEQNIPGEYPPTITVLIFNLNTDQTPLEWALEHTLYSNIDLQLSEPGERIVGGINGVRYIADGLYATEVVIVKNENHMYVFKGGYINPNTPIRRDFETLLESVTFNPPSSTL